MGQRSQIYIRYNVNYVRKNYRGLIARYYQWNYGVRMISRARYIMETIRDQFMEYKFYFNDESYLEKLRRICDVNFDMKNIVMSCDIINEWAEQFSDYDFNNTIFKEQDNNDGQLYIDVANDGIKYCLTRYCAEGEPMDAEQYMKWDCEGEDHSNWHVPYKYMDKETIDYTEENIRQIGEMANLMTMEELKAFIEDDYSYLCGPLF